MKDITREDIITPTEPTEPTEPVVPLVPLEPSIPSDEKLIENAKKTVETRLNNIINTGLITLIDESYSLDITWQYPLNKDLSAVKIAFKLPYGYFTEDLIAETVRGNPPIRKKVYFNIFVQDIAEARKKLKLLFKKQTEVLTKIDELQIKVASEIDELAKSATGLELQEFLNNLILGFEDQVREISFTDSFNYKDWVYKI